MALLTQEKFYKVLDIWGSRIVEDARQNLIDNGSIASSSLYNSLDFEIREEFDQYILSFSQEDYGKYVEFGSSGGAWPPISKLKQWCQLKGIPEGAAYPIRKKIWKFGIPPRPFLQPAIDKNIDGFIESLLKTISSDVAESVTQELYDVLKVRK